MLTLRKITSEEMLSFQEETKKNYRDIAITSFGFALQEVKEEEKRKQLESHLMDIISSVYHYNVEIQRVSKDIKKLLQESSNNDDFIKSVEKYANIFGAIYGIHDSTLRRTVKRGNGYKNKTFRPSFPKDFNETDTLFFKIEAPTEYQLASSFVSWLNASSPQEEKINFPKQKDYQGKFHFDKQEMRLNAAIFRCLQKIDACVITLDNEKNFIIPPDFFDALQKSNYEAFKHFWSSWSSSNREITKKIPLGNGKSCFYLLSNAYCQVKEKHPEMTARECLQESTHQVKSELRSLFEALQFATTRANIRSSANELPIDILMISKRPEDIARKSTYVWWEDQKDKDGEIIETCMCADAKNHDKYVPISIGYGCMVAVGLNSSLLDKWLCRVDVNPFESKKHERFYKPGNLYGQTSATFLRSVEKICATWNDKKSGRFWLPHQIYADGNPRRIDIESPQISPVFLQKTRYEK